MNKISAKEARENTIAKKKESFYESIKKSIEKGFFDVAFKYNTWRAEWEELMNEELEEQGYNIFIENDYVYISWR